MLPFEDLLGYVFRKKVAQALRLGAAQYVKGDHHPPVRNQIAPRKWTGEGPLSQLLSKCPFDMVIWVLSRDGAKIKIRSEMDIATHHDTIWYLGSIVDTWLKTPMLTFNRAFPDEINIFKPVLCPVEMMRDHRRLAVLCDLSEEFDTAYVDGLPPGDRPAGRQLVDQANLAG